MTEHEIEFRCRVNNELAGTVAMLNEETRGNPKKMSVIASELQRMAHAVLCVIYGGSSEKATEHMRLVMDMAERTK